MYFPHCSLPSTFIYQASIFSVHYPIHSYIGPPPPVYTAFLLLLFLLLHCFFLILFLTIILQVTCQPSFQLITMAFQSRCTIQGPQRHLQSCSNYGNINTRKLLLLCLSAYFRLGVATAHVCIFTTWHLFYGRMLFRLDFAALKCSTKTMMSQRRDC